MRFNQKGFSIIIAAIIVVTVVSVWAVGFYVVNNSDDTVPVPSVDVSANADATSNATGYIVVKEWGVKIPITDALKDVTYTVDEAVASDEGFGIIELSTKQITATNPDCKVIYTITRSPQLPLAKEDGSNQIITSEGLPLGVYLGEIDKFHYVGKASSEECLANNANQETQVVIIKDLDKAAQGLTKN